MNWWTYLGTNMTANLNNFQQKSKWNFTAKDIEWTKSIIIIIINVIAFYACITFPYLKRYKTFLWAIIIAFSSGFGITAGAHRYWAHKSYKAKLPMRIILALFFVTAFQMKFIKWISYHRVHHKFTETDADPHNSKRGFFFAHIGWAMIKRHPEVIKQLKQIDMSDIKADPVVVFFDKYFTLLTIIVQLIAIVVPVYFWNELWYYSIMAQIGRFVHIMNYASSVNSFAHLWGSKPYNKNIAPTESKIAQYLTWGEGWHNYHHTFPNDYRSPEFGLKYDLTGTFIRFCQKIGWAYDLKQSSDSVIKMTMNKRGDGSFKFPES